jgi:hypothetical protein
LHYIDIIIKKPPYYQLDIFDEMVQTSREGPTARSVLISPSTGRELSKRTASAFLFRFPSEPMSTARTKGSNKGTQKKRFSNPFAILHPIWELNFNPIYTNLHTKVTILNAELTPRITNATPSTEAER